MTEVGITGVTEVGVQDRNFQEQHLLTVEQGLGSEQFQVGVHDRNFEEQHLLTDEQRPGSEQFRVHRQPEGGGVRKQAANYGAEMLQMMDMLLEDRRQREAQQLEDRRRWDAERARREAEHAQHVEQMQAQVEDARIK